MRLARRGIAALATRLQSGPGAVARQRTSVQRLQLRNLGGHRAALWRGGDTACSARFWRSAMVGGLVPLVAASSLDEPARRMFCAAASFAQPGCRVKVQYTGRLEDGTVFDSTDGKDPLTFTLGEGSVIKGFDSGVKGMSPGEKKEVRIPPEEAYGERDEVKGIQTVPRDRLPGGDLEVGAMLRTENGQVLTVTKVEGDQVTLDLNHPLAGKTLIFELTLVEIMPPMELKVTTLSPGDGKTFPKPGDKLEMHYTGTLADTGAKFDSSLDRGQPFAFTIGVGQVIKGWDEGVMKMSLGEKARLEIPSAMGYGERGVGPIPPGSDLVFEVELLKIN